MFVPLSPHVLAVAMPVRREGAALSRALTTSSVASRPQRAGIGNSWKQRGRGPRGRSDQRETEEQTEKKTRVVPALEAELLALEERHKRGERLDVKCVTTASADLEDLHIA